MDKNYDEEEVQQEETLATPGVLDKYQTAGKICNAVLEKVIQKCVAGANVVDICEFGDKEIESEVAKVYNKKKLEKGIAFPTCLGVNEICGHFSPLKSEPTNLKDGDLVKIDLGVHVDGFIAQVAHTVIVSSDAKKVHEGRKADAIHAAYNGLQAAVRVMVPGAKNYDVTDLVGKIAESYKCNPVEGVLSHEVKKHLIDGNNCIINKSTFDQKVDEHEFQVHEVYGLDVFVSTGDGKPKETEYRTTVFKRAIEKSYSLKLKASRSFFAEVAEKYPTLGFSLRSFEDETSVKLGINEAVKHDLFHPYPVLAEKSGEYVAHFKSTVVVGKNGCQILSGLPVDLALFKTEHKITDEEVNKVLAISLDRKDQKKEKKKTGDKPEETKKN
jgi:curved DNA binding protein